MRKIIFVLAAGLSLGVGDTRAQNSLSAYADANGFLDMHALTCAQLANTWQEDADLLSAWYSGWYNGLAKMHFMDIGKGKIVERELILHCKAHPEQRITEALAAVFWDERIKMGIHMK